MLWSHSTNQQATLETGRAKSTMEKSRLTILHIQRNPEEEELQEEEVLKSIANQ